MGVANFPSVCSSRDCRLIVVVSFTEDMTKSKHKRKALNEVNDKVSIVKQLKSSSVAIIAEQYEFKKHYHKCQGYLTLQIMLYVHNKCCFTYPNISPI